MLAEPHLPGSEFGELQHAIWKRQFEALRDGDRFFYANDRSLRIIQKMFGVGYKNTLKEIIVRTTGLPRNALQPNLFRR
jgi:peroxidase